MTKSKQPLPVQPGEAPPFLPGDIVQMDCPTVWSNETGLRHLGYYTVEAVWVSMSYWVISVIGRKSFHDASLFRKVK